jgi:hypothetical protein
MISNELAVRVKKNEGRQPRMFFTKTGELVDIFTDEIFTYDSVEKNRDDYVFLNLDDKIIEEIESFGYIDHVKSDYALFLNCIRNITKLNIDENNIHLMLYSLRKEITEIGKENVNQNKRILAALLSLFEARIVINKEFGQENIDEKEFS